MKKISLLIALLIVIIFTINAKGQSITTNPLTETELCPNSQITISFTATGTFNSNNRFLIQYSDASGSFTTINYLTDFLKGTTSGSITTTLPAFSEGSHYRFRVVSSSPYVIGSDNGSDITIHDIYTGSNNLSVSLYSNYSNNYYYNNFLITDSLYFYHNIGTYINDAEWNFGDGANPQTSTGYTNPVKVTYSSLGTKDVSFQLKPYGSCTNSWNGSLSVNIFGCEVEIDSTKNSIVIFDSINHYLGNYSFDDFYNLKNPIFWILPGGGITNLNNYELNYRQNLIIIVETGGTLTGELAMNKNIVYAKVASSVKTNFSSEPSIFIVENGASVSLGSNMDFVREYNCPSLSVDYGNAPKQGLGIMQKLGYLGVQDNNNNALSQKIEVYPNPTSGIINLSQANSIYPIRIYSQEGVKVFESEYQKSIDISNFLPGIYFLTVGSNYIKIVKI